MKELVLVSCSGGMDSSLTLWAVKTAGYKNVIACHFNYGHRGSKAEELAITNVCYNLAIPLKIFNLSHIYKEIKPNSMLTDNKAKITTGTFEGLKQLDAWVPGRNMMFLTVMATFAESEVMKHDYDKVYLMGGFLNLTESGSYPDNSEYFLMSALELFKYGTLIGNRIEPLLGLSNLMKSDQYEIIKQFELYYFYKHTISCDRPTIDYPRDDYGVLKANVPQVLIPKNCMNQHGIPACGSGLLSYYAGKMVGIDDTVYRNFYTVQDDTVLHEPEILKHGQVKKDITQIINRIKFPQNKLDKIHKLLDLKKERRQVEDDMK